jgi:hypothetical protein
MKMKKRKSVLIILTLLAWTTFQSRALCGEVTQNKDTGKKPCADNTLTEKQKAAGWQLLFDGKTLNGWSVKDCELTEDPIGLQSEGAPIRWRNIRILER